MAEFVVRPLVSMLTNKASSYLLDQYKVMNGMEEQRETLKRKLLAILDVIQDAEEKGASRPGVSAWLEALKKASYEAKDVFDEFKYEALRRDAKKKGHYKKLGFDIVSLFPAHNPIVFRYRMGKKLCRIVRKIEGLVREMNDFGFNKTQQAPPSKQWRNTDSIIIDSEKDIVSRSRNEEKKKIVDILIDQAGDRDLIVLPIVGMGGLGKTTFAQLVYNDPIIKEHFKLQRWCCVSDDFDVVKIANIICETNEIHREKALQNLQKEVSGKRYLIVLDDVWNEDADKWEKLKTCLKHGGKGSAILTTTRNVQVARIMKMCIADSHNLRNLDKVFLKEIFENRAFCLQKPKAAELSDVVDKIMERCGGSPLAAKAFGSMLSNKTSMKEWTDILARSNTCNDGTETFLVLKLSYDDLPSHLKQCFAFCAIFPKDYEIDVETLIQLWMAHDFIPLREGDNLEKVGREIFDELTWRSFFQDVKQNPRRKWQGELRPRTICKIHDLMHDIALSVMGKDCLTIVDRPNEKELLSTGPTRYLFSSYWYTGTLLDDYLMKHSPALQTLLYPYAYTSDSAPHLSKYNHLRALQLFRLRKLPLQPRHLQHLRYLDLSNNILIEELPEEISILYNLQTLNLCKCIRLGRLPEDMKCMENLRHLYTNGCSSLKCMPPGLGQLTSLQTLTYFVVSSSPGCSTIRELQDLNLGGDLELSRLQYATEVDAKACSLGNKDKLTHLSLKWGDDSTDELGQHRNVLDALKPHAALEFLGIHSYRGTGFSAWVLSLNFLQHLTELQLDGCTMCEEFPQFGEFKSLEVLVLKRLNKLQSLCNHNSSAMFPALKDLRLKKLEIFERCVATEGEELAFPQLENVKIKDCPKLAILPEAPKLKFIALKEEKAQLSLSIFKSRYMACLSGVGLSVSDDTEAAPVTELDQDCEVSLLNLRLDGCNFLFCSTPLQPTVGVWKWFGQLVHLTIESCDMLIYWPEEEFRCLVSLNSLSINSCSKLVGHTQGKGCRTQVRDQLLPNLKELTIYHCGSLTELFVLPPSLTSIVMMDCNSLESILGQDDTELESILHSDTASSSEHFNDLTSTCLLEQSLSPRINPLPCLDYLRIISCKKLRFMPAQLDALIFLDIHNCDGLESLDCLGDLPLLEYLYLNRCKHLASVPGSLGSYSALQKLRIEYCPALNMKPLYGHLQQRLDSLELKDLSKAGSSYPNEGPKLREPKCWKF
ncbi:putative disease resistance protein RGA1 isoform X1 [Aegilops tauschii subsp. strangulata]|uniref:Disease resistance protein RGA4 n=3 Tax=Aegilops tauschii subsp. strangulata TaxID=200361 RepID=A0A452XP26_AEGTS|nr:putative disease resistance protein RGA1 [Aegilops tauschii subsp. strangulata]